MLTSKEDIVKWLDRLYIKYYTINDDLSVDSTKSVYIHNKINILPLQFNYIQGDFDLEYSYLLSLKGLPNIVTGYVDLDSTLISSLHGAPNEVGGSFYCSNCPNLTSLKGLPLFIGGTLTLPEKFIDDPYLEFCTYGELIYV